MATAQEERQDKHREQHPLAKQKALRMCWREESLPTCLKGREGEKEKEREHSSLSPGSSKKCSALQPEMCPKYFTPLLLYPQLWGSGWIIHREEEAVPEAAPRQEVLQDEQAGRNITKNFA